MPTNVELVKKVCLIGDPGVGKTSLIRRFVLDQFSDDYLSTIGAKVTKKEKLIDIKEHDLRVHLNLMIWDVAGQKEYQQFHEMYLKGMEGVLAVCDLSRRNTFERLKDSLRLVEKHAGSIPVVFMLNKADLVDLPALDLREVNALASQRGIPVLPTSAKTGQNVESSFSKLTMMIIRDWLATK
ncbi:MAG: GTP-binding protein [Euryarchaeota archaeon]|nr:GTP-binding protein [Euryarchaeota archaeon]